MDSHGQPRTATDSYGQLRTAILGRFGRLEVAIDGFEPFAQRSLNYTFVSGERLERL